MIRNADVTQESAFTVTKPDGFMPPHHPLRAIRVPVNKASTAVIRWSSAILAGSGRDTFAPEEPGQALSTAQRHSMCTANALHTPDAITRHNKHQVIPHFIAWIFGANSITSLMPPLYFYSCHGIRVLTNISCARILWDLEMCHMSRPTHVQ